MRTELPESLAKMVHPEPMTGCWLWSGHAMKRGYGILTRRFMGKQSRYLAHRFIYALLVGDPGPEKVLDHKCRVKLCVNPDHLRPGSDRDNIMAPGSLCRAKANADKEVCPRCYGQYEFAKDGKRFCRPCRNKRQNEYQRSRRAS